MPQIEIDDVTMETILNHQARERIRSRGKALADLVERGAALTSAERGGFDLAPVLKQQLVDAYAELDRRTATT